MQRALTMRQVTRYACSLSALSLVLTLASMGFLASSSESQEGVPTLPAIEQCKLTYVGPGVDFGPGDGEPAGLFDPGPGDGEPAGLFDPDPDPGPGDGEPAGLFRGVFRLTGDRLNSGSMSVYLEGQYLYTVALPGDGLPPGIELRITDAHVQKVLGREMWDPDLPPVTVSVVLYNHLTMGFVGVVQWKGYLQGSWLEFPQPSGKPKLKPLVDISEALGQSMLIDVRLERDTIYYLLFASEDESAVLLHPEDPEIYLRARVVAGGSYSWNEEEEEGDAIEDVIWDEDAVVDDENLKNVRRLKYTPAADREFLVLWTLHQPLKRTRAEGEGTPEDPPAPLEHLDGDEPDTKSKHVIGWTRSAVYELTTDDITEEVHENYREWENSGEGEN